MAEVGLDPGRRTNEKEKAEGIYLSCIYKVLSSFGLLPLFSLSHGLLIAGGSLEVLLGGLVPEAKIPGDESMDALSNRMGFCYMIVTQGENVMSVKKTRYEVVDLNSSHVPSLTNVGWWSRLKSSNALSGWC